MNPPLNIRFSFPKRIDLTANLSGEIAREITVRNETEFAQNKTNPREWLVSLGVHIEGKDAQAPYFGHVEYVGIFSVAEDYPEKKMGRLVAITAPSILYGAVRELVAFLTGRGPHRPVMLPTVSFQGLSLKETGTGKTSAQ